MLKNKNDILPVQTENIPAVLKERDRWVLWKPIPSKDDPTVLTKTPFDCLVPSKRASHSDPDTWRSFKDAEEAYRREENGAGGIMIALGAGLAGIDLDDAVDPETGRPVPEAQAIIDRFDSYTEFSVSGKGIRIFLQAHEAPGRRHGKIELYSRERFLTVTGHLVPGARTTIENRADEFEGFLAEIAEQRAAAQKKNRPQGTKAPCAGFPARGVTVLGISDEEIVRRAHQVCKGFETLWKGDFSTYEDDRSRADLALAGYLAFMCGPGEHERVEQLMRSSGLVRDKWDRHDYLSERTIPLAYEGRDEFFQWKQPHRANQEISAALRSDEGKVDTRPVIIVGPEIDAVLSQLEQILAPFLFQRAGRLVEIVDTDWISDKASALGRHHRKAIAFASVEQVQRLMSRYARFVVDHGNSTDDGDSIDTPVESVTPKRRTRRQKGLKEVSAPKNLAQLFTKCEQWEHIPKLNGLMQCPYMGPGGSIVSTPGYDRGSGYCLLDSGVKWVPVPEEPSQEEVAKAINLLMDLVADFPFDGPASRSAWLAGLLTAVARPAIDGPVPMLWVDANRRGTGKSKLGRLIGIIATGTNPTELSWTGDEQEMEKRIASLLSSGSNFAQFDNAVGSLRNPILERFLTSSVFDFRRFHRQELANLPNRVTLALTGNNLTLRGDLPRRVIRCRLVTAMECPEARDGFRHADIEAYATANQPELLAAALTILRAHAVAVFEPCMVRVVSEDGTIEEHSARPIASFEQWDRCVRHAILRAGLADPVDTQDQARDEDDDDCKLVTFLAAVHAFCPGEEWSANSLLTKVYFEDHGVWRSRGGIEALAEAIHELTDTAPGKIPEPKILGYRLKDAKDKPLGGYCLRKGKRSNKGVRYLVVRESDSATE